MKFTILRDKLNESIQQVSRAIPNKTTISILLGIKISATEDGVSLTASDSDISIQSYIPAKIDDTEIVKFIQPGSIVLPAKFFVEIAKKLPSMEVEIEVTENYITKIRSGSTDIQLVGLDADEFPILPQIENNQSFAISGFLLKTMIKQTVIAVSTNESASIITGIAISLQNRNLKFISTDRHRLALREAETDVDEQLGFHNIVISGKTLNELSRIIPDDDSEVQVVVSNNQVLFKINQLSFYTHILDGTFPDTTNAIQSNFKTELILDRQLFTDAIERTYLLSREDKTNIVKLISLESGVIEVSSSSTELGKVTEQLQTEEMTGEPLKISFNSKYMFDLLKVIDSEQIHIGFTGAMSPIIIKPLDETKLIQLILPYRTTY